MVEQKEICNKYFKKEIKIESPTQKNILFISENALNLGKTVERISWNLHAEYAKRIKDQTYSWEKSIKDWRKFEEGEIEIIKNIK